MSDSSNDLNFHFFIRRDDEGKLKPADIVRAILQLAETWTLEDNGREALETIMVKNEDIGFQLGINEVVIAGHMFSDAYVENMRQKLEAGGHLDVHMGGMISSRGPHTHNGPMTIPINVQEILEQLGGHFTDDDQDGPSKRKRKTDD